MERNKAIAGLLIIAAGIILLLSNTGFVLFTWKFIWPIFILIPGIAFHLLFFSRVFPSGVLIPGGILTTVALLFFYCNLFGWSSMKYLWPVFILAPAIGLYEFYLYGRNVPKGVLLAASILGGIAAVMFSITLLIYVGAIAIAAILIIVGIWLLYRKPKAW